MGCHTHNLLMETALSLGFPGLLGLLWLTFAILYSSYLGRKKLDTEENFNRFAGCLGGMTVAGVNGLFDYPYGYSGIALPLLALVILLYTVILSPVPQSACSKRRPISPWLVFPVIALCLVLCIFRPALSGRFQALDNYYRLKANNPHAAYDALKNATMVDPWDVVRHRGLANETAKNGQWDEAFKIYQECYALEPTFADFSEKLGNLSWYFGNLKEAEFYLRKAVELDPFGIFFKEHYSDLALFLAHQGKKEEAIYYFAKGILIDPAVVQESYWRLISVSGKQETLILQPVFVPLAHDNHLVTSKFTLQQELLEQVLKRKHPKHPQPFIGIEAENRPVLLPSQVADAFCVDDVVKEVLRQWHKLSKDDPLSEKIALVKIAKMYENLNRFDEKFRLLAKNNLTFYALLDQQELEVEYLKPPLPGDEPSRRAPRRLGNESQKHLLPDVSEVIENRERQNIEDELKQQLALVAAHPTATNLLNASVKLLQLGKKAEARTYVNRLLELEPYHAQGLHLLATMDIQAGQYEKALTTLLVLKKIVPDVASVYTNLGIIYALLGKSDLAIAEFLNGVRINPSNPQIYYNLGNLYAERGQLDKAFALVEQGDRKAAFEYIQRPNLEEAFQYYSKTISLDNKAYFAYYNLAKIFEANEAWRREALATWEKFLDLTEGMSVLNEYRKKADERIGVLEEELEKVEKPRFVK